MTQTGGQPHDASAGKPVFGVMLLGGGLSGALVRDVRLANELADRGCRVHAWWLMDRPNNSPLRDTITQSVLFNGYRYMRPRGSAMHDRLGRFFSWYWPDAKRARTLQKRPELLETMMANYLKLIVEGVEHDMPVVRLLASQMDRAGVTHMLPMLEALCPWVAAARRLVQRPVKYLVTFQGYELYVNYARRAGCEQQLYERLRETVDQSDYRAITVSEDYRDRVVQDIGVSAEKLVAIPPGVPTKGAVPREQAIAVLQGKFQSFRADLPLVTYLGRQDVEKGIDLLLYAAAMLRRRGAKFQLAIAGPTLFGNSYSRVIRQIAEDLRCDTLFAEHVSDEVRQALFSFSRCVVYPSIHREPFGMVSVEALACGTPVIVPDYGGVAETIRANGVHAGLTFNTWDSGDLAEKMSTMLHDHALYAQLSAAGPQVADYYSVQRLADRVLAHLGLA